MRSSLLITSYSTNSGYKYRLAAVLSDDEQSQTKKNIET